jgi:hypothetical protein
MAGTSANKLHAFRMMASDLSLHALPFTLESEEFKVTVGKRLFSISIFMENENSLKSLFTLKELDTVLYNGTIRILVIKKLIEIKTEYALVQVQDTNDLDIAAFVRSKRKKKKRPSKRPTSSSDKPAVEVAECPVTVQRRRFNS